MWNTNKILRSGFPDIYRSEAIGLKTGSTKQAGNCLLSAFFVEGGYIIIGVFGCPEKNDRFTDTNALFDFYLSLE
jgi:D-alanyl-D-alanine carboxypeptidase